MPIFAERPDKGTTIQNPSVALLCINSYDMYQESNVLGSPAVRTDLTPYNSLIYKKQALLAGAISRIALTELNFNWAIPTVNGFNDKFVLTQSLVAPAVVDIVVSATIPHGWYNFTDLALAIQTALNAAAALTVLTGTFQVSVDAETFFFKVQYTFGAGEDGYTPLITTNDLSTMLGFNGRHLWSAPAAITASITGNFPTLTYTPYIDIVSQRLTKNQHIYDNSSSESSPIRSLLARIYLNPDGVVVRDDEDKILGRYPFTIKKEFQYPKQIAWEPTENVDSIDLLVLDWKGRQLYNIPAASNDSVVDVIDNITGNAATFQLTFQSSEN